MARTPNPTRLLDRLLNPAAPERLPPPPLRRQHRIALGISQQQVADVVAELAGRECDRSTVGRWERELGKGGRDIQGKLTATGPNAISAVTGSNCSVTGSADADRVTRRCEGVGFCWVLVR